MKERPILMSTPMVRAILDGKKTQTRRIVKPQPTDWTASHYAHSVIHAHVLEDHETGVKYGYGFEDEERHWKCPYGAPGDRLWVKETFQPESDILGLIDLGEGQRVLYRANLGPDEEALFKAVDLKWRPSISMPRWASRITLEVVSVRVERLNDISRADAIAEGGPPSHPSIDCISREFGYEDFSRSWYAQLWEHINGPDSWALNPWVWAVEFKVVPNA